MLFDGFASSPADGIPRALSLNDFWDLATSEGTLLDFVYATSRCRSTSLAVLSTSSLATLTASRGSVSMLWFRRVRWSRMAVASGREESASSVSLTGRRGFGRCPHRR